MHTLSALFLIGLAGSAVVVFITFIEDFGELFGSDDAAHAAPQPPPADAARQKR